MINLKTAKALSISAAACASRVVDSAFGLFGFTSMPIIPAVGTNSLSSPSRFATVKTTRKLTPVRLPPGRLRLATKPAATGSKPVTKTTGIVVVAAFAAWIEMSPPIVTMTSTRRLTKSAAKAGNRSI